MDFPRLPDHRPLRHAVQRFLRCDRGMSLVELLVVIPMMGVVLLGIYALYNVGAKGQRDNNQRVTTLLREQNGLERMTREMRQAITFTPVSSQILDATTYVVPSGGGDSVQRRVRYECDSGSCVRYEGPPGGALAVGPETVISGVKNPDVFFFEPDSVNPTYVAVKLEVSVKGANNPIVLDGGFALRNKVTS
jgi:prepilin-type N-terminal cleavage/methylation domain-containing protein